MKGGSGRPPSPPSARPAPGHLGPSSISRAVPGAPGAPLAPQALVPPRATRGPPRSHVGFGPLMLLLPPSYCPRSEPNLGDSRRLVQVAGHQMVGADLPFLGLDL